VGLSITSFAALYEWVLDGLNWEPEHIDQANKVIFRIANSTLEMAKIFQGWTYDWKSGKMVKGERPRWSGYPTTKWAKGVVATMQGFGELYEWVFDGDNWEPEHIDQGNAVLMRIAEGIVEIGSIMSPLSNLTLPKNTSKEMVNSLKGWQKLVNVATQLDTGGLSYTAFKLMMLASGVDSLAKALTNLNIALGNMQSNQLEALTNVSGAFISFSVMDSSNFEDIMDIVEDKSSSLAELFGTAKDDLESSQASGGSVFSWDDPASLFGDSKDIENSKGEIDKKKTLDDVYAMLTEMNSSLSQISSNSATLSSYVNELRANPNVKIK